MVFSGEKESAPRTRIRAPAVFAGCLEPVFPCALETLDSHLAGVAPHLPMIMKSVRHGLPVPSTHPAEIGSHGAHDT